MVKLAVNKSVRDLLQPGSTIENRSLLFEKYLLASELGKDEGKKKTEKDEAFTELSGPKARNSGIYRKRNRKLWDQLHMDYGDRFNIVYGRLESRLAINLAEGILENAGIALDRTFGVPYIPGSAFKGCCHHAAYWLTKTGKLADGIERKIFGSEGNDVQTNDFQQGYISFLPVHAVDAVEIEVDILTPHRNENGIEKDPIPNKFPVVKPGPRFAFAYFVNSVGMRNTTKAEWADLHTAMIQIIEAAFVKGLGAKTAAGYGWFVRDNEYEKEQQHKQEQQRVQWLKQQEEAARQRQLVAQAEKDRQEQEAKEQRNREENEKKAVDERRQYEQASPLERFKIDAQSASKNELQKLLAKIHEYEPVKQRILLDTLLGKDENKRKRILKDKKLGQKVKTVAQQLNYQL